MHEELYAAMARVCWRGKSTRPWRWRSRRWRWVSRRWRRSTRALCAAWTTVGEQYGCGDLFLPDLVAAAEAMKAALAVLEPALQAQGGAWNVRGRVVIGTIQGDIHDIGKTLVGTMLSANGFQVYDLGVNVAPATFAAKAREVEAHLVGVSAC
jgi:trimethylamine corrinoid protein